MKIAALAALSMLIALPAEAGQRHRQHGSPATRRNSREPLWVFW
jgi:hypothetical protein